MTTVKFNRHEPLYLYIIWKCFKASIIIASFSGEHCRKRAHPSGSVTAIAAGQRKYNLIPTISIGLSYIVYFRFMFQHTAKTSIV